MTHTKVSKTIIVSMISLVLHVWAASPVWPDPDGWGRTLPGSKRPQVNTQAAPGAYTIAMTTQYIQQAMAEQNAVGLSIALVNADGILWEEGFGWADKENQIPAEPETVYMIGSVTKFLTAVSLVRLHEQGLLDLDDPLTDYLPQFRMADRYTGSPDQISLRRLLNHHSGIPGDIYAAGILFGETWEAYGCGYFSDWLTDYLKTDYPSLAPGTMAVYSNTGFVLAGEAALAVDGLSGESFPGYMDRVMFSPLKMAHTSLYPVAENLSVSYVKGSPVTQQIISNCSVGASGGIYSSVRDMAGFLAMILNRGTALDGSQYLTPQTVDMLGESETSQLDVNSYGQCGLGLDSVSDPVMAYAGRAWTKSGSTGTYYSFMEILPDQGVGVVILTNSDTGQFVAYGAARECLKHAVFERMGLLPSPPDLPDYPSIGDPTQLAGIYAKGGGWDGVTDNGDGTLTWTRNAHRDDPASCQLVYNGTGWDASGLNMPVSFLELSHGPETYLTMVQSGSSGSPYDETLLGGYVRYIIGNKISPPAIPPSWQQRTGLYVRDNIPWNEYPASTPAFGGLWEKNGLLLWSYTDEVLLPENDTTAFVAGLTNRSDSSMRVVTHNGMEKLMIKGARLYKTDHIPVITPGQAVNGDVNVFETDWYRFDAPAAGQSVTAAVENGSGYYIRVYDAAFSLVDLAVAQASWVTAAAGPYYFSISPTPAADNSYKLTFEVN